MENSKGQTKRLAGPTIISAVKFTALCLLVLLPLSNLPRTVSAAARLPRAVHGRVHE